jgi:hypothetical protein
MMATEPTLIKLEPKRHFGRAHYRVLRIPLGAPADASAGDEIAILELNQRIVFADGQVFAIVRRGSAFSTDRELWRGSAAMPGEQPLAVSLRERIGFLRWRDVLVVGAARETRYLLRRRSRAGSPANADVIPLAEGGGPQSEGPVVLRGEKVGFWRSRLQAQLLDPSALSLPVAIFVLNVLAVQEQAATAAAASAAAGAAGA